MSKIMPPVTLPWNQAILRRHQPPPSEYTRSRDCLRWEFGFSCAFCLLHESDLSALGVEGLGIIQIEHFAPQSRHPERINEYSNLFLICRLCNVARGAMENLGPDGSMLLDPCTVTWDEHFQVVNNRLLPVGGDPDAIYTCETYNFNDSRKVKGRRLRRVVIEECLAFVQDVQGDHTRLLDQAEDQEDPKCVELAKRLHRMWTLVREELLRFQAIPLDSKTPCFCDEPRACALPKVLEEQIFPMPEL